MDVLLRFSVNKSLFASPFLWGVITCKENVDNYELLLTFYLKLKADRPHPQDYPHTPPDYRRTDKCLGLLMTTLSSEFEGNGLLLHSASRAPNIDRYAPYI